MAKRTSAAAMAAANMTDEAISDGASGQGTGALEQIVEQMLGDPSVPIEATLSDVIDLDDEESYAGINPPGTPGHEAEVAQNIVAAEERGTVLEEDSDPTIVRLKRQIVEAQADIVRLEGESGGVALADGNLDVHLKKLALARDRIAPLNHALGTARSNHKKHLVDRDRQQVEQLAASVLAADVPALKEAWATLNQAMQTITDTAAGMRRHVEALEWANLEVDRIGRSDLAVPAWSLRRQVVEQLLGRTIYSDNPAVERMERESDDAFDLRRGNIQARAIATAERTDPMLQLADHAIAGIFKFIYAMDAHQAAANRRLVSVTTSNVNGQKVQHIGDVLGPDGQPITGAPHRPRVGPYHNDGSVTEPRGYVDFGWASGGRGRGA